MRIYLIRHGRQNSILCNVDVELSKEGRQQAELLRDRLVHYPIDALYASDLIRAKETAMILNEKLQLPLKIREGIREISFGELEGKSNDEIVENFKEFKEAQNAMVEDIPYPEGENGQSVFNRAFPVIEEIIQSGNKNVCVVTHGGVIRALLAGLIGRNQAERFLFGISLDNTSITELVYDEQKKRFYLERFNDWAHLEAYPKLWRRNW